MLIQGKMTVKHKNKNLTVDVMVDQFSGESINFDKQMTSCYVELNGKSLMVDEIDAFLDSDSATITIGTEFFHLHGLKVRYAELKKMRPGLIMASYSYGSCTCGEV